MGWLSGFSVTGSRGGVHKMALSSRIRICSWLAHGIGTWIGLDRRFALCWTGQVWSGFFSGVEEQGLGGGDEERCIRNDWLGRAKLQ